MLFVYGMDLVVVNASKLYGTPALTPLGYQGYMPYPYDYATGIRRGLHLGRLSGNGNRIVYCHYSASLS